MEDYIYILIGLLWIVFSVIKANKKAKQQLPEADEYEDYEETVAPERSTFDELFEQFVGEKAKAENPPPPDEPRPQPQYQTLETFTPATQDFENRWARIEKDFSEDESNIYKIDDDISPFALDSELSMFEKKLQQSHPSFDNKPRFDLRQAVIYSVLLQRPYA